MRTNLVTTILATTLSGGCVADDASLGSTQEDSAIIAASGARWPNPIPYLIDTDGQYTGKLVAHCEGHDGEGAAWQPLPAGDVESIRNALDEYSEVTPLRFREVTPGHEPTGPFIIYTRYTSDSGSFTSIPNGMPSDGRPGCILLDGDVPIRVATVLHETGHALGMVHEQQRYDAYTTPNGVIFDHTCITDDAMSNYTPVSSPTEFEALAPYDWDSIMEYSSDAGCNVAACKPTGGTCAHPVLVKNASGCTKGSTDPDCQIPRHPDLSTTDVNVLTLAFEKPLGTNDAGDHFGAAVAVGDFDGDGFDDLAVGAPGDTASGQAQGAVYLFKGTSSPFPKVLNRLAAWKVLTPPGDGLYTQFGASLAVGDFDGDGRDDLVVAAPGAVGGGDEPLGGAVFVYRAMPFARVDGTVSNSLDLRLTSYTTETNLGLAHHDGDRFGASLAAGDFDGDGFDDLAVGIPHRTVGGVESGAVQILTGGKSGALGAGALLSAADVAGGQRVAGARFGFKVLAKDLDPDVGSRVDLVVGAPGENDAVSGDAYVFRGTAGGLVGATVLDGAAAGAGGRFGSALAAGDFDGRTVAGARIPYVAVGASGVASGTGKVFVFSRSAGGFTFARIEGLFEPSSIAQPGDHLGASLGSYLVDGPGNPALIVGAPGGGAGGRVLVYRHASGGTLPLDYWLTTTGLARAGDAFGTAIAAGDFVGLAGEQNELVFGSVGALGGAGNVVMGDVTAAGGWSWQPEIDQESASPE